MSDDKSKIAVVMGTGAAGIRALTGAGQAVINDPILIEPSIKGPKGRAWHIDYEAMRKRVSAIPGKNDASLGTWLIEAPWAHPIWHSYVIALIHLRPLTDVSPPKINMDGATHEFWLWAANPEVPREPFIRGQAGHPIMWPVNFGSQIRSSNDEAAIKLMEHAIGEIVGGRLSPDTDAFDQWVELFGDSSIKPEFRK
ncbi:MAG TPA: hypothetical protein VIM56_03815 [Rhizomicrobium sp.]